MNVIGQMQKSTTVMQGMQRLISLPQLRSVCTNLSKEMVRAGIMEETINDAMSVIDGEDIETEADEEVDKVLYEVTEGVLGQIGEIKNKNKVNIRKNMAV